MPIKVLFTPSYFYKLDEKQWKNKQPYPPYATILCAAVAQQNGFEVSLFDSHLKNNPSEITDELNAFKPNYVVIVDDSFNYLSKMCLTVMREACFNLIKLSKQHNCTVIVNSSDATDNAAMYLNNGADVIVLGEAETTIQELLNTNCSNLSTCLGIAFKQNNLVIKNSKRPINTQLNLLPMPAWHLINVEAYKKIWITHHQKFSLNIATTRGCPFKCNWCAKPIYGNRYNSRNEEQVVTEMKLLMHNYGATHFWICDDIFGLKPGWVQKFSALLKQNNLKPKLKIQCRADLLLKEDTIESLVQAGLDEVWMGAESGSQKILDAMDKGTTIQQIYEASFLLKKHGVKVCLFLQYGYLGEEKEDIDLTLKMVKEILPHDIGISVSYPLPETKFFNTVKEQLKQKKNWVNSNDLDMMYNGTYGAAYYKELHVYTHYMFRRLKGIGMFKSKKFSKESLKFLAKLPLYTLAMYNSNKKLNKLASNKPIQN